MTYDVQLGNGIRRGITYAELISLPIEPMTMIRRGNSEWIMAKDCVELTHVLCNTQTNSLSSNQYSESDNINSQTIDQDDDNIYEDGIDDSEPEEEELESNRSNDDRLINTPPHNSNFRYSSPPREPVEESIFVPTAEYFKCKQKRKAAIIGVCTLGLAGLTLMGVGNTWRSNIFEGTSFMSHEGMAFILKCLSFCFLTALIAIPYFIFSFFALIYYSIRLSKLK